MLSKNKFSKLSLSGKSDIVFNIAKHVALRYYYNHAINLYSYNGYFIEVWYQPNDNRIDKIEVLKDVKKLDLYIDYMLKLKEEENNN